MDAHVRPRLAQYALALVLAIVTVASQQAASRHAAHAQPSATSAYQVWWYGWLTAISTGAGALPMVFMNGVSDQVLGFANAIAVGMMTAASGALLFEGFEVRASAGAPMSAEHGTLVGAMVGVLSMIVAQFLLRDYADTKYSVLNGLNARKAVLIVLVMTAHSFSEGIGIGVACAAGGEHSLRQVGMIVTATLAVHNVPEGFAVSVALVSGGMSVLGAGLWSVFTSLPQPIMALAAYFFIDTFTLVQPLGLGFAAGAMLSVAWLELFFEAHEACGFTSAASVSAVSAAVMWRAHELLE